jgi:hypothetical protein
MLASEPGEFRRPADETLPWTTNLRRPAERIVGQPTKLPHPTTADILERRRG